MCCCCVPTACVQGSPEQPPMFPGRGSQTLGDKVGDVAPGKLLSADRLCTACREPPRVSRGGVPERCTGGSPGLDTVPAVTFSSGYSAAPQCQALVMRGTGRALAFVAHFLEGETTRTP